MGHGTTMPRLPALHRPKKKCRLASQTKPRANLEEEDHEGETAWRRNYATLRPLAKEVYSVLKDQTRRGQLISLPEAEARAKYSEVTARVLHGGTNGLAVNSKRRLRDQERSPISSDVNQACARRPLEVGARLLSQQM